MLARRKHASKTTIILERVEQGAQHIAELPLPHESEGADPDLRNGGLRHVERRSKAATQRADCFSLDVCTCYCKANLADNEEERIGMDHVDVLRLL